MGAHEAYMELFLKHQDDLRAFIGSLVRDRHLREDIFQEVAIVLWNKFDQFDTARSFGAWARGIAANKIMQFFDKQKRRAAVLSPEAIESLLFHRTDEEVDSWADEQAALEKCVRKLPRRTRRLIAMRYEQAMKLREIADEAQATLDAVHKTLSRARDALRKCVERELAAASI